MYINLVLGVVALVVLWLFLRRLLVREDAPEDALRESPAELLEKEVARRRAAEEENARVFERLRDVGRERLRPVVAALGELRSAMPAVVGETPAHARKILSWDDNGDSIFVRVLEEEGGRERASLAVSWRVPDLDLQKAARYGEELPGMFVLRRSDTGAEERAPTLDACMRDITSFIVDFMA